MQLPLVNIHTDKNHIFLFLRRNRNLIIQRDFYKQYYYEESPSGVYQTITGKRVKKILCREPYDAQKNKSDKTFENDLSLSKRYIIDKIDSFTKTDIKYLFIGTEQLTPRLPNFRNPIYPIDCISSYDNYSEKIQTWFLLDYEGTIEEQEKKLLLDFIRYLKEQKADLCCGWNFTDYDYPYLYKRIEKILELNLASEMSPIKKVRRGIKEENIFYPAGISIMDYMGMFSKLNNKESSYALDEIAQKHLGESSWQKTDFNKLTPDIKEKNIHDVDRLVSIEKKFKLIPYFDNIRIMSKCLFEDVLENSRVVDCIVLNEAKKKSLVLPSKKFGDELTEDNVEKLEGAYRRSELGRFEEVYDLDLNSAYPSMIKNFCLDTSNLRDKEGQNIVKIPITDRETIEIKKWVYMYQNDQAIIPHTVNLLLKHKNELKKRLKEKNPGDNDYKELEITYAAQKGLTNSGFGVIALRVFRLFNIDVASCITSLVRDLLYFIEDKCNKNNIKILFIDTDSFAVLAKENPVELFNQWVQDWVKEKYNKESIDLEFTYEGKFKSLFLTGNCHMVGWLERPSGLEKITKGVESKKRNSNDFIKEFQPKLYDMILDNKTKEECITYILSELKRIESLPVEDVSFPAKIVEQEYKVETVFIRAIRLTKELNPNFNVEIGNNFKWLYVKSLGQETKKGKQKDKEIDIIKEKNVIAYTDDCKEHLSKVIIDWDMMKKLNILNKAVSVFYAMGWIVGETDNQKMKSLKLLLGLAEPKPVKIKKEKVVKPKKTKVKNKEFLDIVEDKNLSLVEKNETLLKKEVKPYYIEDYYE